MIGLHGYDVPQNNIINIIFIVDHIDLSTVNCSLFLFKKKKIAITWGTKGELKRRKGSMECSLFPNRLTSELNNFSLKRCFMYK